LMSKTLRSTLMENPWFLSKPLVFPGSIPNTNYLTSDSSSLMSKTLRSTLIENSWFLENRCFFYLCGHTSKQTIFFPRLFSTRKRIRLQFAHRFRFSSSFISNN
jgi:hypothetical protein